MPLSDPRSFPATPEPRRSVSASPTVVARLATTRCSGACSRAPTSPPRFLASFSLVFIGEGGCWYSSPGRSSTCRSGSSSRSCSGSTTATDACSGTSRSTRFLVSSSGRSSARRRSSLFLELTPAGGPIASSAIAAGVVTVVAAVVLRASVAPWSWRRLTPPERVALVGDGNRRSVPAEARALPRPAHDVVGGARHTRLVRASRPSSARR